MVKFLTERLVISILLIAGGIFLVSGADTGSNTARAQVSTYRTTWKANPTALLKVSATFHPPTSPSLNTGDAIFGVWRWDVIGLVGTTAFKETWKGPPLPSDGDNTLNLKPGLQEGCDILAPVGYDASKILIGCITSNKSIGGTNTLNYKISKDTTANSHLKSRYNAGSGSNRATSCINSPRNGDETECLVATGAYSFSHLHEPGSNAAFRWLGAAW